MTLQPPIVLKNAKRNPQNAKRVENPIHWATDALHREAKADTVAGVSGRLRLQIAEPKVVKPEVRTQQKTADDFHYYLSIIQLNLNTFKEHPRF